MRFSVVRAAACVALFSSMVACSDETTGPTSSGDPQGVTDEQVTAVLESYVANLSTAYSDAVDDEDAFAASVDALVAGPTDANLAAARTAWFASRAHYMLVEGARFYGGPIDVDPPNHEGAVNSWPLDEAYIDYTTNADGEIDDTSGFVNHPDLMPDITVAAIDDANTKGGDTNISDGYHAQEFLLWGQALKAVGPGERPASDYSVDGPRPNAKRRGEYLKTAAAGVLQHLTAVRDAWKDGATYRADFVAGGRDSIAKALTGLGRMSKGELAGERINAAYASKERRDQHDCFSSMTLADYDRDARGIQAMYLGTYGGKSAPGISSLVATVDADLDARIQKQLQASVDAINAIPPPFEAAIVGADSDPGRTAIRAAVESLRAQGDLFADAATALGLKISVPEEN